MNNFYDAPRTRLAQANSEASQQAVDNRTAPRHNPVATRTRGALAASVESDTIARNRQHAEALLHQQHAALLHQQNEEKTRPQEFILGKLLRMSTSRDRLILKVCFATTNEAGVATPEVWMSESFAPAARMAIFWQKQAIRGHNRGGLLAALQMRCEVCQLGAYTAREYIEFEDLPGVCEFDRIRCIYCYAPVVPCVCGQAHGPYALPTREYRLS